MSYKFDENGKISDDDKLYKSLDKWHDKDEYERIVSSILGIPREQWSVRLWFRLISAYNNLKQFDKARGELRLVEPLCVTPKWKAYFCYMHGYIYSGEDKDMMAISCYNDGKKADPGNEGDFDFDGLIKECREYIDKDLKKLGTLSDYIAQDIKEECAKKPDKEKTRVSEDEFTMYLGFLPLIRKIPGTSHSFGFEYFCKYKGEEKQAVLNWFKNMFNITDRETFRNLFTKYAGCNIANLYNDVPPYLAGKPDFDISELNEDGMTAFMNAAEFFKPFVKYLPEGGVLAWDISEKVGFAWLAYSCDLIGNTDYCTIMMMLTEQAQANFSSFEEYMLSLAFGCGVYMFHLDRWNIGGAMEFMRQMVPMILHGDLPHIKWRKKLGRPSGSGNSQ